ncbi:unnamed protein product [Cylindrotheca closterium]|uniref:Uncharacterized protein n=1 Tax=Cylindrotheca closterium TaxID=2856 RepID=A0AAD2FV65_9STRA|nr:unnamed protein product [Cylindrotheca closterium]
MTNMDCPAENATLSESSNHQRLDKASASVEVEVVVSGSQHQQEPQGEPQEQQPQQPMRSCLKRNKSKRKSNTNASANASANANANTHHHRVGFVEFITVSECLHHLDYTKKEYKGTWFTPKEMSKSREDYRDVLQHVGSLAAHLSQDEELCCTRGLEYKTPMGNKRREQNKRVAWQAVEREQYRQWDQGFKDEQALADEYQIATHHCVKKAILLAQQDRQAVLAQAKYYQMDGLSLGSSSSSSSLAALSIAEQTCKSTTSSSAHSRSSHNSLASGSPLFVTSKHHHGVAAATSGRRPVRSQGRVSRAA